MTIQHSNICFITLFDQNTDIPIQDPYHIPKYDIGSIVHIHDVQIYK